MAIEDICALPVKKLITPSSMLFLWTTSAMMEKAFQVMKAWGFSFTGASFVWVKTNPPFIRGNYNFTNHELLLVGKVKKSANFPDKKWNSVVEAPKTKHSKKPEVFYEIIEDFNYSGPKLELFARNTRKGWKSFGNQIEE
jgi:site-specific DNA-methyltransferase (adenine-specific)